MSTLHRCGHQNRAKSTDPEESHWISSEPFKSASFSSVSFVESFDAQVESSLRTCEVDLYHPFASYLWKTVSLLFQLNSTVEAMLFPNDSIAHCTYTPFSRDDSRLTEYTRWLTWGKATKFNHNASVSELVFENTEIMGTRFGGCAFKRNMKEFQREKLSTCR